MARKASTSLLNWLPSISSRLRERGRHGIVAHRLPEAIVSTMDRSQPLLVRAIEELAEKPGRPTILLAHAQQPAGEAPEVMPLLGERGSALERALEHCELGETVADGAIQRSVRKEYDVRPPLERVIQ